MNEMSYLTLPDLKGYSYGINPDVSDTFGTGQAALSFSTAPHYQNTYSMSVANNNPYSVQDMEIDPCPPCFMCESVEYYWPDRAEAKGSGETPLYFCNQQCYNQYRNRKALFENHAQNIEHGSQTTPYSTMGAAYKWGS